MSVTQITDDNIDSGIDTSKCIGAIGAMDGSALTNINVGTSLLKYGFNPAVDTNPADGVGAIWINTVTGQMFSCTDATTDQNTWTNMGSGTGHITYTPPLPWAFGGLGGGTVSGWMMGSAQTTNVIQSYSYVSDGNAVDRADLSSTSNQGAGNSSATHGYKSGGHDGSQTTLIQKFAFVNPAAVASNVGNLETGVSGGACSVGNTSHAYTVGGHGAVSVINDIQKFSYVSEGTATTAGAELTLPNYHNAGSASLTYGYSAGGQHGGPFNAVIDRFAFASDGTMFHVGDLTTVTGYTTGESSDTHGYTTGGMLTAPWSNSTTNIQKYAFASDAVISTVAGSITQARMKGSSSSSSTRGYHAAGHDGSNFTNRIDRFDFANEATTAIVGNMLAGNTTGGGSAQS
jgi:hypothetical protein